MKLRHVALVTTAVAAAAGCGGSPDGNAEKVGWTSDPVVVCAGGSTVKGVDVSTYQGAVDWGQVHGAGIDFAITRVSDGTGTLDGTFATNWKGIKAAGMVRGVYQFFEGTQSGTAQADLLVSQVNAAGGFQAGDIPPVADVEVLDGASGSQLVSNLAAWVSEIEAKMGVTPIIYTAPGFWNGLPNNTQFGAETLWVANWQVSCPDTPSGWSSWKFWQYDDGQTTPNVPGISGAVDKDEFNGSLAQLQGLTDQPPTGWLDKADCTQVAGWGWDPDTPGQAANVDVYFGGPAGSGAPAIRLVANVYRSDLCTAIGSCSHGFSMPTPLGMMDGQAHGAYPYGIDTSGNGDNPLLQGAPKSFTCPPPAIPYSPAIKRHVTDPTVYAAWHFVALTDQAQLPDTEIDPLAQGPDIPASPQLVTPDDGSGGVYVVDGAVVRHVQDPASMAAWHFDWNAIQKVPAATFQTMTQGLPWPETPFLAKGTPAAVWMIDVTTAAEADAGAGPGSQNDAGAGDGGAAGDEGGAGDDASWSDGAAPHSSGGCAIASAGASEPRERWSFLALAAALAIACRCRRRAAPRPV